MGVCRENPQDTGTSLTHPPGETTLPPRCQPQAVSRKHAVLGLGTAWNLTPCGLRVTTCDQGWRISHGTRPGWIEVISGVMFAGKSEELIRRVRRAVIARKQVQVFKSHLDARYAGLYSVTSHDGLTVEAEPVDSAEEIARRLRDTTEVVAVDEAQFLDDGIVDL